MNTFFITHYETVLSTIAFLPLMIIVVLYLLTKKFTWQYRYTLIILLGWGVLFADVLLIQHLAINYAPSPRLREHAASEDGASTAFVYLFGWILPLIITLILDLFRWLWKRIAK